MNGHRWIAVAISIGSSLGATWSCSREDSRAASTARPLASGEDPSEWSGSSGIGPVEHWKAIQWNYAEQATLRLLDPPSNLESHRAFRFVVAHAAPTNRFLELIVESDDDATAEIDGWTAAVPLDFKGPMRIVVQRDEMAAVGRPRGWDRVTGLSFCTRAPAAGTGEAGTLGVAALDLADVPKEGIVLSDGELFDALDLDRSSLAAVREALEAKDETAAVSRLADHLRRRLDVTWQFDADGNDDDDGGDGDGDGDGRGNRRGDRSDSDGDAFKRAESVARGSIELLDVRHDFENGEIDWNYNPTRYRPDLDYTRQWASRLNDMKFWRSLSRAYVLTRDERFARAWVRQFRSFVRSCPFEDEPDERLQSRPWHAMRAANRMCGSWPDAFVAFRDSPSVTDRDLVDFLKSTIEHGRHLRRNHDRGVGEHQNFEMLALYTAGAFFPELREAPAWREHAFETLAAAAESLFYEDGVAKVLSPSYHARAIRTFRRILDRAVELGRTDEIPRGFLDPLEAAVGAVVGLMTPDRELPTINDCTPTDVMVEAGAAVDLFPDDAALRWVASDGTGGSPPGYTSISYPWAGYHVMRSGWDRDANYLCFDNGPLGTSHCHQDMLNVVVHAFGRPLLFDDGGGEYEESAWRQYATDTFSHNLVIVDGNGQRRQADKKKFEISKRPIDSRWESTAGHDFAAGTFDGKWGTSPRKYEQVVGRRIAAHSRRVLFVKPDRFLIADTLEPHDEETHTYQARWQLQSTSTIHDPRTGVVVTDDPGLPNLAVVPLLARGLEVRAASGRTDPELLGWRVRKYEEVQRKPATTVLHARTGTGPMHFLTLLVPLRAGEANPVGAIRENGTTAADVSFTDGTTLAIEASADPSGIVSVVETRPDGTIARRVVGGR